MRWTRPVRRCGICSGNDGSYAEFSLRSCLHLSPVLKVWIQFCGIRFIGMIVASARAGLPKLNQRASDWEPGAGTEQLTNQQKFETFCGLGISVDARHVGIFVELILHWIERARRLLRGWQYWCVCACHLNAAAKCCCCPQAKRNCRGFREY